MPDEEAMNDIRIIRWVCVTVFALSVVLSTAWTYNSRVNTAPEALAKSHDDAIRAKGDADKAMWDHMPISATPAASK